MHHNDESIHIVSPGPSRTPQALGATKRSPGRRSRRDRCRVRPSPSRRAWTIRASAGRVLAGVVVTALLVTTAGPWRPADGAPRGPAERAGASVGHVRPYETAERRRPPSSPLTSGSSSIAARTQPSASGTRARRSAPTCSWTRHLPGALQGTSTTGGSGHPARRWRPQVTGRGQTTSCRLDARWDLPKGIYAVSAYLDHEGDMGNGGVQLTWYSASPVVGDELGATPVLPARIPRRCRRHRARRIRGQRHPRPLQRHPGTVPLQLQRLPTDPRGRDSRTTRSWCRR